MIHPKYARAAAKATCELIALAGFILAVMALGVGFGG
jgi:hypothetical protein